MNGDILEFYNKIHTELEVFKGIMEERWKNHANREDEVKEALKQMNKTIINLPKRCPFRLEISLHRYLIVSVIIIGIVVGYMIK